MRPTAGIALLLCSIVGCGGGSGDGGGGGGSPTPLATVFNTQLAVAATPSDMASLDPFVIVRVSEAQMGADLNGDGDNIDLVVHVVDTSTQKRQNLSFATTGSVHVSDTHFAFLVSESGQNTTDLNGDLDTLDAVWYVYDPTQAMTPNVNPRSTGIVTGSMGLPATGTAGGFVFVSFEAAAGMDFSGDGDTLDSVVFLYDTATQTALTQGRVHNPANPFVARGGRVLFSASESFGGSDLNGDLDILDTVLIAADFLTVPTRFVTIGGATTARAVNSNPYALTDHTAVYLISEVGEGGAAGLDLNGDGDTADHIIAVFDFRARTEFLSTTPFAVNAAAGIGTAAERAVFDVEERAQGNPGVDLNNDFDLDDLILAWIDTENAPTTVNFPTDSTSTRVSLVALTPKIDGTKGIVVVSELRSGPTGTDYNGDLDFADAVAFAVDFTNTPGTATNLGFAVANFELNGPDVLLGVSEQGEGSNLNGDGDTDDVVLRYVDLSDSTPMTRSLGTVASATSFFRFSAEEVRIAAILPEGQSPNFDNLNGDGDTDDNGLVLLGTNPLVTPPGGIAQTPFFGATASAFSTTPPLLIGTDVFAFATSEPMEGSDLNGDGDANDTVLQYIRYAPPPPP